MARLGNTREGEEMKVYTSKRGGKGMRTVKPSLDDRIRKSVGRAAAPSMVPVAFTPPPLKEIIPDLRELVNDPRDLSTLSRLIDQSAIWGQQEKEAKRERKPLTEKIKALLGSYGIGRAMCGDRRVIYFNVPRSSLSKELLLSHGVSPQVLEACTVTKDSYTLRITEPGEENGYE